MPIINQIVKGSGGSSSYCITKSVDATGYMTSDSYLMDFSGVTRIGSYAMCYAYYHNTNITGAVNLSDLTTVEDYGLQDAFLYAHITSLDLSNLETLPGQAALREAFYSCQYLVSVNLSKLKSITGQYACVSAFSYDGALVGISLPSLELIGPQSCQSICSGCSNLAQAYLPSLVTVMGQGLQTAFGYSYVPLTVTLSSIKNIQYNKSLSSLCWYCSQLTTLSFPALDANSFGTYTNQFEKMLTGTTGVTVHFPSNIQSVIGSWTDVIGGFDGTNTVVLFDLPSTAHLFGVNTTEYERNPKYDTATALAWRVKDTGTVPNLVIDWTPFYTSGTTDPAVGDTIYSDAACTTTVTTIDSIA